jgi:hypothetical protein
VCDNLILAQLVFCYQAGYDSLPARIFACILPIIQDCEQYEKSNVVATLVADIGMLVLLGQ